MQNWQLKGEVKMLEGVIAAHLTLFKENGDIDYKEMEKYFDFLHQKGVKGIFACGTTSEGLLMSTKEREEIFKISKSVVGSDVKVIANCSSLRIEETKTLISSAKKAGDDAIAILPPLYYRVSEEEMINYFSKIIEFASNFPVYIYNIPSLAVNAVNVKIIYRLLKNFDNFFGIKDSSGNFATITKFVELKQTFQRFEIAVGFDRAFLSCLIAGADGTVSGPAAVFPEPFIKVYELFKVGNFKEATKIQKKLVEISSSVGEGYSIPVLKEALKVRGFGNGNVRLPLVQTTKENLKQIIAKDEEEIRKIFSSKENRRRDF